MCCSDTLIHNLLTLHLINCQTHANIKSTRVRAIYSHLEVSVLHIHHMYPVLIPIVSVLVILDTAIVIHVSSGDPEGTYGTVFDPLR